MFSSMNVERSRTIANIVQLVYFMRGSIQYESMMRMSLVERQAVSEFIEARLDIESKKTYPQY